MYVTLLIKIQFCIISNLRMLILILDENNLRDVFKYSQEEAMNDILKDF